MHLNLSSYSQKYLKGAVRIIYQQLLLANFSHSINRMTSVVPKVYIATSLVPDVAVNILKKRYNTELWAEGFPIPRGELLRAVRGVNGLFCSGLNKIDSELLDAAGPQLRVIGTVSVGYDHVDLPECKKRNILVGNTPDVLTDAVAELAVGLLLATSRKFFSAHKELTSGAWEKIVWAPMYLTGTSVNGSTVGIVGFGRIGQAIGKRLNAFNIKNLLYSGNTEKPEAKALNAQFVPFNTLLEESDFVIVACALNQNTAKLIDKEALRRMKKSAILVNVSRGGVVDQDALIEALQNNEIAAAGLDVMTPEPLPPNHILTTLPNCTLLPHIGSADFETRVKMCTLTAENIIAGIEGKPLPAPL